MDHTSIKIVDRVSAIEAINRMSEDDLRYLNRLIVERIRLISQARATGMMTKFTKGDLVRFETSEGRSIEARVERLNKKTISVVTDSGLTWKVSPGFLRIVRVANDLHFPLDP